MEEETQTLVRHLRMKLESMKKKQSEEDVILKLQKIESDFIKCKREALETETQGLRSLTELKTRVDSLDLDVKLKQSQNQGEYR